MKHCLSILISLIVFSVTAQEGLEGIYVEKYYVADANDTAVFKQAKNLEVGMTTYRIYVDLMPGYRLQAVYGAPGHPLVITSSSPFYNHAEAGTSYASILPERTLKEDVSLLDSWLTMGPSGENHLGIPRNNKEVQIDTLLQLPEKYLNSKKAKLKGKTFKESHGMVLSYDMPFPTFFQIDSCMKNLGMATLGDSLVINNGAWAVMGKGAVGADSLTTNMVLIAQLTTSGGLNFELNLMISTPEGKSIKYVAKNPVDKEKMHPALTYSKGKKKKRKSRSTKL
jgi:hypothetical protein